MHQQKKDELSRDPYAMLSGGDPPDDFPDWNNPEDQEDAPEGYYDAEDEVDEDDDETYVPGPDDPDYDLSEQAGYAGWEAPERSGLLPQWIIVVCSILLILALVIPVLFVLR